ncbi:MAG TPA: hypothetical protein VK389_04945 [Thermoanaerobaculia bacterium]|nr:hypothetical protein [Thermoanaerobaculia bacterium]
MAILRRVVRGVAVFALLIGACLLPLGCGDEKPLPTAPDGGPGPSPLATYTRVQNEVFTLKCALSGCHLGPASAAQEGLVLSSDVAYDNIVMVRSNQNSSIFRVTPGDPTNSYLWRKINPGQPIVGERMPQTGSITESERQLVTDWIQRGAPRD